MRVFLPLLPLLRLLRTAGLWLVLGCGNALACGHCVEDRIAAVYDHALQAQTLARGHQLAYFSIDGLRGDPAAQRRQIERALRAAVGVDAGSVRIALDPAALVAGFDPLRQPADPMAHALQRAFARQGMSLQLLRVVDGSNVTLPVVAN